MVTTPIKNFLSRAKTSLSSFLSSHSVCMSINCQDTTVHVVKLQPPETPVSTSGCMTLNCPSLHSALPVNPSRAYGPRDSLNERMDSTTHSASLQNPCPDLDPLSSMDSLQTHDSLVTPESPYSPSPVESLEEGTIEEVTQVRTLDSLAYDSLVTALSRLSLKPDPDPLSDHQ